jgi:hypothetical protein
MFKLEFTIATDVLQFNLLNQLLTQIQINDRGKHLETHSWETRWEASWETSWEISWGKSWE